MWGKSKDYKSSSKQVNEEISLPTKMADIEVKGMKELDQEVVTIVETKGTRQ